MNTKEQPPRGQRKVDQACSERPASMRRWMALLLFIGVLGADAASRPTFGYDRGLPLALRTRAITRSGTVETRDITFTSGDQKIGASLVRPIDGLRHAGILFVHWLGDPKTTNRSEFMGDAVELAKHGATSLLIDAMWAQTDWFDKRTTAGDYAASITQVIALRRALDVLAGESDVDPARIAYVGHDFGAMYGALVAGVDARPSAYVFMTPTVTFWEWYLLGARPADKYAYIDRMRVLDTVEYLPLATMQASLLQFGKRDTYVPAAAAREFIAAVPDRDRTVKRYDADHDLAVDSAQSDRRAWLISHLSLRH